MNRAALGAVIGLMAVGALVLAIADRNQTASAYPSVEALGRDINLRGVGCDRLYPTRSVTRVGEEMVTCLVGSDVVTLHTFNDVSLPQELDEPSPRSGVAWVVGPNWLVATMSRPAAVRVASAIGGDVIP